MTGDEHDRGALAGHALNALAADERASVEEHVARCEQCRQELIELRESVQALRTLPTEAFLEGPPEAASSCCRGHCGRSGQSRTRRVRGAESRSVSRRC